MEKLIEEYPDDYPYPSCLILGMTVKRRRIHVVVGVGEDSLWLITAYEPNSEQWDSEYKIRRNDKMRKCFYCKGNMADDFSNYM